VLGLPIHKLPSNFRMAMQGRGVVCNVDGEMYKIHCPADVPISWLVSELIRQHAARTSVEETHIVGLRNTW
jgi:hypothetical protein